jgi:uncharacterized protein
MNDTGTKEIPLFPLSTVVFPGGLLPLRIFEKRYVDMVGRCMREDCGFGVTLIARGREVGDAAQPVQIATVTRIVDFDQGGDGLLHITGKGERKVRILSTRVQDDQLLLGTVTDVEPEPDVPLADRHAHLAELVRDIIRQIGEPWSSLPVDYASARDIGARLTELLPLPAVAKLQLLLLDDPQHRVEAIAAMLEQAARDSGDDRSD